MEIDDSLLSSSRFQVRRPFQYIRTGQEQISGETSIAGVGVLGHPVLHQDYVRKYLLKRITKTGTTRFPISGQEVNQLYGASFRMDSNGASDDGDVFDTICGRSAYESRDTADRSRDILSLYVQSFDRGQVPKRFKRLSLARWDFTGAEGSGTIRHHSRHQIPAISSGFIASPSMVICLLIKYWNFNGVRLFAGNDLASIMQQHLYVNKRSIRVLDAQRFKRWIYPRDFTSLNPILPSLELGMGRSLISLFMQLPQIVFVSLISFISRFNIALTEDFSMEIFRYQ